MVGGKVVRSQWDTSSPFSALNYAIYFVPRAALWKLFGPRAGILSTRDVEVLPEFVLDIAWWLYALKNRGRSHDDCQMS